jgi:hypothetical protein
VDVIRDAHLKQLGLAPLMQVDRPRKMGCIGRSSTMDICREERIMTTRHTVEMIGAGMVIALWTTTALAQAAVYSGQIVNASGGRVTIQERSGQKYDFPIARDIMIVRDGQPAKLDDLQSSDDAMVAVDESMVAITIDAKSAQQHQSAERIYW